MSRLRMTLSDIRPFCVDVRRCLRNGAADLWFHHAGLRFQPDLAGYTRWGRLPNRKPFLMAKIAVALLVLPVFCSGCAWRLSAPGNVSEPVPVFLTDYGRHTRLALPADDESVREYGFGEWHFYALRETGPVTTVRALFGFGRGTLAYRTLPRDEQHFRRAVGGRRTIRFYAEKEDALRLLDALDEQWRSYSDEAIRQAGSNLLFVPLDDGYHGLRNSNFRTAEWLRQLGCEVRGYPLLSNFRVVESE